MLPKSINDLQSSNLNVILLFQFNLIKLLEITNNNIQRFSKKRKWKIYVCMLISSSSLASEPV